MIIKEDLYLIEDLFRAGSAKSPRLDNVRDRDIEIIIREGNAIVLPHTGGISVFNRMNPRLRGTWWRIRAGAPYPGELKIICDRELGVLRHYSVEPAFTMALQLYKSKLREFGKAFEKCNL